MKLENSIRVRIGRLCMLAFGMLLPGQVGFGANYFDPQVRITNIKILPRDARTHAIQFDVSWDSASRNDNTHTAAWVFFKVRANKTAPWQHVRLAADRVLNPDGYGHENNPEGAGDGGSLAHYLGKPQDKRIEGIESRPDIFLNKERNTPLEFLVPDGPDGFTGVFLRRAGNGGGAANTRAVTLLWDITLSKHDVLAKALSGAEFRAPSPEDTPSVPEDFHNIVRFGRFEGTDVEFRSFGVEMVYVAEGPYYLGTGGPEVNAFHLSKADGSGVSPYRVTGPGAIPTGREEGRLWANGASPEDGGEIPASFPNGFRAFYCMRQHVTPGRYAQFLSTMTPAQAEARGPITTRVKHGFRVLRIGRAPDYLFAYRNGGARDGSGMRMISWADSVAYASWAGLRPMSELELEKAVRGPRYPVAEEVGPSYWGIRAIGPFEWESFKSWEQQCERVVTVGNATGSRFKGTHGRGTLTPPVDWPKADAVGSGFRIHYFDMAGRGIDLVRARASDRMNTAVVRTDRNRDFKFRAVRTAPLQNPNARE
ncbi:MAG: SUMF1/EgtB/PvdO family nonheme iron enzyme [Planctomycetota bacterium]|jgi:hypothetical protein|nr:SUMF1/EgtB/PvdO family nonheme iron enzyme [Planctomycetota bacterium]